MTRGSWMGVVRNKQNMFCAHGTPILYEDWQAPLADIYAFLEPLSCQQTYGEK